MSIRRIAPGLILALLLSTPAHAAKEDFFGWYALTLSGDFEPLSPDLKRVRWLVMNQTRLGDDSSVMRENLLFAQIGYQLTDHISLWLGYTHNWLNPAVGAEFNENRIYQDFRWDGDTAVGRFSARSRFEQRFRDPGGTVGARFRQFVQLMWPIPGLERLQLVGWDEIFVYMNDSFWGNAGFNENRAFAGFNLRITDGVSADLGYMNQFVSRRVGPDRVNHTLFTNINLHF